MALFDWFGKKNTASPAAGKRAGEAQTGNARLNAEAAAPLGLRADKNERRELLYGVVRESMARAGLISSSYKFKVLSLDVRGMEYMVMVDVESSVMSNTEKLQDMEKAMAQAVKLRYQMQINAVYWRSTDPVLAQRVARSAPAASAPKPQAQPDFAETRAFSPHDQIEEDELQAFKKALATAPAKAPLTEPGQIVRSGPRKPMPARDFQPTVMDERSASPLSSTQWGDL